MTEDDLLNQIEARVLIREPSVETKLAKEYIQTAIDRIKLRLRIKAYDERLNSIVVDVALAMYRKAYHEGIKSESVDVLSVTFVDDLLAEYKEDFAAFKALLADEGSDDADKITVRLL